jgi:hypothetical protein
VKENIPSIIRRDKSTATIVHQPLHIPRRHHDAFLCADLRTPGSNIDHHF